MERQLHVLIALFHGRFKKIVFKEAFQAGLHPGQPKVLEYVYAHPGCAQGDICAAWDVDKSTVSGLVDRLEQDGLIRRQKGEEDQRKKAVYLTERGQRLWAPIQQKVAQIEEEVWQGIGPEQRRVFLDTIARINENMKRIEGGEADEQGR